MSRVNPRWHALDEAENSVFVSSWYHTCGWQEFLAE
jgi:hypothetical protein